MNKEIKLFKCLSFCLALLSQSNFSNATAHLCKMAMVHWQGSHGETNVVVLMCVEYQCTLTKARSVKCALEQVHFMWEVTPKYMLCTKFSSVPSDGREVQRPCLSKYGNSIKCQILRGFCVIPHEVSLRIVKI